MKRLFLLLIVLLPFPVFAKIVSQSREVILACEELKFYNLADPRLKVLGDGTYMMLAHSRSGQGGVQVSFSEDLAVWSRAETVAYVEGKLIMYADAVVLPDGEIQVYFDVRPKDSDLDKGEYIARVVSRDCGHSWSEPQTVIAGMVCDPFPFRKTDGTLLLYYSDMSGICSITSDDSGQTWKDRKSISSDARDIRPSAVELPKGKMFVVWDYVDKNVEYMYRVDSSYGTLVEHGSSPYVCMMPSGKTALSYAWGQNFLLLSDKAKDIAYAEPVDLWNGENGMGFGSVTAIDDNTLAVVTVFTEDRNRFVKLKTLTIE